MSMSHQWIQSGHFSIRSQARDSSGLSSAWSTPLNISVEQDIDNDGLSNVEENALGSNPSDSSDVKKITLQSQSHFLVTLINSQIVFYNISSGITTAAGMLTDGTILIDENNDHVWDFFYYPTSGVVRPYTEPIKESFQLPWLWIFIGIIVFVILLVFLLLYKKGYIYLYEEYVVEE